MSYAKSRETITNILAAARTLFVDKNYANVTIVDIAEEANVSTGALYHHFSSKEDVYLQMMHHYLQEIQENMDAATDGSAGTCRERLYKSNLAFARLPDELQGVLRLVRRDINIITDPMRDELIRAYQSVIPEPVEAILRDGIASGELKPVDPRLLSWEFVAMVEVTLSPYSRNIIGGPDEAVQFVLELLLDGIAVHEETERI
jgi:AcrR family transcriptional regulator